MQYMSFDKFECTEQEYIIIPALERKHTLLRFFFFQNLQLETENFLAFYCYLQN